MNFASIKSVHANIKKVGEGEYPGNKPEEIIESSSIWRGVCVCVVECVYVYEMLTPLYVYVMCMLLTLCVSVMLTPVCVCV